MKARDRMISLVVVGAVIGAIWYVGSKWRGGGSSTADADAPVASATASASASASASVQVPAPTDASASPPPVISGACRAMTDASKRKLDDAKTARACTPDLDKATLACRTSSNGATWGLRVDDVVDLSPSADASDACPTGWLVRLVHIDVNGVETALVPGISATQRAHTYDVGGGLALDDATFFDWDGDGEDELFVRGIRGAADHPTEQRSTVWTFHTADAGARIQPYAAATNLAPAGQALTITDVRDVDGDGRPDLLATFFGVGPDAPPTTHQFMAHSLDGGAFSLRDAAAVAFAQKQCPSDPNLDLATKSPSDFDDTLADAIACALLWGHTPKEEAAALAKGCAAARAADAGVCPVWAQRMVQTKPPLSLR